MMSPYAFYQFWLNADDASVISLPQGLHRPHAGARSPRWRRRWRERPFARRGPAHARGRRDHAGARRGRRRRRSRRRARRCSAAGALEELDEATLADATAELAPGEGLGRAAPSWTRSWTPAWRPAGRGARRTIDEGGAYVNNVKVVDPEAVFTAEQLLHGAVRGAASGQEVARGGGGRRGLSAFETVRRVAVRTPDLTLSRGRPLMFSTSARQGGTDTARWPVPRAETPTTAPGNRGLTAPQGGGQGGSQSLLE